MFGYIRPRKDELRIKDYDLYRRAYCGLCRYLGRHYGFPARFLVNYDMTFLYLLESGLEPDKAYRRCWCPARVFGKKECIADEAGYARTAAKNVLFCYHKILDDLQDAPKRKKPIYYGLRLVFRRAYRKAARQEPAFDALCAEQLSLLHNLEAANSADLDQVCDTFARLVQACASDADEPSVMRPKQILLYQTGRFIYLADALDDLAEDCRAKRYNPLRYRFGVEEDRLSPTDLDYLSQLMDTSVNLAGSALALLPLKSHKQLLENIIFLGMPTVFAAVKQGKYRSKDKI